MAQNEYLKLVDEYWKQRKTPPATSKPAEKPTPTAGTHTPEKAAPAPAKATPMPGTHTLERTAPVPPSRVTVPLPGTHAVEVTTPVQQAVSQILAAARPGTHTLDRQVPVMPTALQPPTPATPLPGTHTLDQPAILPDMPRADNYIEGGVIAPLRPGESVERPTMEKLERFGERTGRTLADLLTFNNWEAIIDRIFSPKQARTEQERQAIIEHFGHSPFVKWLLSKDSGLKTDEDFARAREVWERRSKAGLPGYDEQGRAVSENLVEKAGSVVGGAAGLMIPLGAARATAGAAAQAGARKVLTPKTLATGAEKVSKTATTARKAAELAAAGGATFGAYSLAETLIDPRFEKMTPAEKATHVAVSTALGAVLEPAIVLGGPRLVREVASRMRGDKYAPPELRIAKEALKPEYAIGLRVQNADGTASEIPMWKFGDYAVVRGMGGDNTYAVYRLTEPGKDALLIRSGLRDEGLVIASIRDAWKREVKWAEQTAKAEGAAKKPAEPKIEALPGQHQRGQTVNVVDAEGNLITPKPVKVTDVRYQNGVEYVQVEGSKTYFPASQIEAPVAKPAEPKPPAEPPTVADTPVEPKPPATPPAPAGAAVEPSAERIVYGPKGQKLTVVDESDPSLLTVRNEQGTTFKVGRKVVSETAPGAGVSQSDKEAVQRGAEPTKAPAVKPEAKKEPWEMTREEFVENIPDGYKYEADLGETIARYDNDGKIVLTDAYFGHDTQTRKEILAHEKAHGMVDKTTNDPKVFWELVNSGLFGKYDEKAMKFKGVPYALRNVDEILTQLVADLQLGAPKKLAEKYPVQYNIAQQILDGKNVDIRGAIQKALSEGKPVPEEVLKDYPDLAPAKKEAGERTVYRRDTKEKPAENKAESSAKEGSPEWAYEAYQSREVPEGWFVHGRGGSQELADHMAQATRSWDVADYYAGRKGSVWMFKATPETKVLDMTDSETLETIAQRIEQDYNEGRQMPLSMARAIDVYGLSFKEVAEAFNPENIVDSAEAFDDVEWAEWLYDHFGVDMAITNDGAVILNHENVFKVRVPEEHPGKASSAPAEKKPTEKPAAKKGEKKPEATTADQQRRAKALAVQLRKRADAMQKQIDAKRNPAIADQNPTPRRARIAAGMAEEADALEKIQFKLRAMADAIENDTLPESLSGIRNKATIETILAHQKMPSPWVRKSDIQDLLKATEGIKGIADARAKVRTAPSSGEWSQVFEGSRLDALEAVLKAAKAKGFDTKRINQNLAPYKRVRSAGITSEAEYSSARKDLLELGGKQEPQAPTKERQIKEMERELIGVKIPGFFPTPKPIVEQMLAEAEIEPGMAVLEPSAGKGNIADLIREKHQGADLSVVEWNHSLRSILEAKGHKVVGEDFLEHSGEYDRIVMNPPFEKGQDIDHVRHAYELLKPGGRLVSIMSEGPFYRSDKKATEFRKWLDEVGGTSEKLPEKSFAGKDADRKTGVATRMVVIDKAGVKEGAAKPPPATTGKTVTAKTERGTAVKVQYAVVDAKDLVTSHTTDLKVNKDYPQELQPRDRSRAASKEQIVRMVNRLEPEFLGESPKAAEGAPIVGPDLVVESGNARSIALQIAYEQNHRNAVAYRKWVLEQAEKLGYDKSAANKVKHPVLVRIRQSEVDRVQFTQEANEQAVAAMSASEQAMVDAKKLTGALLDEFVPSESGEIIHRANWDFVKRFMAEVVGSAERGRYVTADGGISQEGVTRIRNAVFAKAYGDTAAIVKLAESTDNNVRNITNAMLMAAPRLAKIKEGIAKGELHDLDLTGEIAAAVNKLSALREQGLPVERYLQQVQMFGEELSPLAKDILHTFNKHGRSAKKLAEFLMAYADGVKAVGDPRQESMFAKAKPTKAEVLEAAIKRVTESESYQSSLFESPSFSRRADQTGDGKGGAKAAGAEKGQAVGKARQEEADYPDEPKRTPKRPQPEPEARTYDVGEPEGGPRALDDTNIHEVRTMPKGVKIDNPEYVIHVFDLARELGSAARHKVLKKALGKFVYGEGGEEVHLATVENLPTMAHEVGHALDFRLSGDRFPSSIRARFPNNRENEQALRAELEKASRVMRPVEGELKGYRRRHTELMADFYGLYVLDPAMAQKLAPTVTKLFEGVLAKHPKIQTEIQSVIEERTRVPEGAPDVDVSVIRPSGRPRQMLPDDITNPTEATKQLVLNMGRIHRSEVGEAMSRAARWERTLTEEQREDLGAAVEKIGNLRTGKSYEDIVKGMIPEQRRILREYRYHQELLRESVNTFLRETGEKEYIGYIDDYLAHFYIDGPKKRSAFVSKWQKHSPNAKARTYPTLQEAVDAGLTPITQDVAALQKKWAEVNWRVALNRAFVWELTNIRDAEGMPVLMKPDQAPPEWEIVDHPAVQRLYAKKRPDGTLELWRGGVAVHPEIYQIAKQVFQQPFTHNAIKVIENLNAYAKKMQLTLSLFHHWALTESAQAIMMRMPGIDRRVPGMVRHPFRGIFLVGPTAETIKTGVRIPGTKWRVTMPHRAGMKLMEHPEFMRDLHLEGGVIVGRGHDVQPHKFHQALQKWEIKTRKMPGVGHLVRKLRQANQWWDTVLWEHYHSGLKAYAYYDLVREYLQAYAPENITAAEIKQIKHKLGGLVNDAFGGQEWARYADQFWGTPQGLQLLHMGMLAPDWTISNFKMGVRGAAAALPGKVESRLVKDIPDPHLKRQAIRYWRNMFLFYGMFLAASTYAIHKKWPWEMDQEPGHKIDINVTPLMKQMPHVDRNDERQWYIRPGKQWREVTRYFTNPTGILGSKASPFIHQVFDQFSAGLGYGYWPSPWDEQDMSFVESVPHRVANMAEAFKPFSLRGNQFGFAFPLSRGMGAYQARRAMEDIIAAQADPTLYKQVMGKTNADKLLDEVATACRMNGLDPAEMWRQANTSVRTRYYNDMWKAIDSEKWDEADRAARVLVELGAEPQNVLQSGQRRDKDGQALAQAEIRMLIAAAGMPPDVLEMKQSARENLKNLTKLRKEVRDADYLTAEKREEALTEINNLMRSELRKATKMQ